MSTNKKESTMPVGCQPPKFLSASKEHTYVPSQAPDVFLVHLLKHILEESGGSFGVSLEKVQESIAKGQKFDMILWLPASVDEKGQVIWMGPGKAALKENKKAALELILGDEPAEEETTPGPVLVAPGGGPAGVVH